MAVLDQASADVKAYKMWQALHETANAGPVISNSSKHVHAATLKAEDEEVQLGAVLQNTKPI